MKKGESTSTSKAPVKSKSVDPPKKASNEETKKEKDLVKPK